MTKERLRHYRSIKKEQEQLRHELEEVESALYSPKIQRLTGMPSSQPVGNPQEDLAILHIELQKKYKEKLKALWVEQLAIETAIEVLEPTARRLLRYRYLEGLKWEDICCRLNYSWRQTHRLHGDALQKLKEQEE